MWRTAFYISMFFENRQDRFEKLTIRSYEDRYATLTAVKSSHCDRWNTTNYVDFISYELLYAECGFVWTRFGLTRSTDDRTQTLLSVC